MNNDVKPNTLSTDKTNHMIPEYFSTRQNIPPNKHSKNNTQYNSQIYDKSKSFNIFNAKFGGDKNLNAKLHISGQDAIAAAASQAIAATQQLHHGRPTPSLKASIDAINSNNGLSSLYNFNSNRLEDLDTFPQSFMRNSNGMDEFQKSNKRVRVNKRNRASSLYNMIDMSNNNSDATSSDTFNTEFSNSDPNEPRYCVCRNISYGEMIECEQEGVNIFFFRFEQINKNSSFSVPMNGSTMNARESKKHQKVNGFVQNAE